MLSLWTGPVCGIAQFVNLLSTVPIVIVLSIAADLASTIVESPMVHFRSYRPLHCVAYRAVQVLVERHCSYLAHRRYPKYKYVSYS